LKGGLNPKALAAGTALIFILSLVTGAWATAPLASTPAPAYPNSSWALGVVVPEGAGLQSGGKVHWEVTNDVTADVILPNITVPDRIVYAVMSVMTTDGYVLQAAAGTSPTDRVWLAFAWSIATSDPSNPVYNWVLNATAPDMSPNSTVTMSIFQAAGSWEVRVTDADTGAYVSRAFPAGISQSLKVGDQEVFALESYSRTAATFEYMGNLTLGSISLDGQKVVSGTYAYGSWDPDHNPVFVVGSSGQNPPGFIYIGEGPLGSYFWDYAAVWKLAGDPIGALAEILIVVGVVCAVAGAAVAFRLARRPAGSAS